MQMILTWITSHELRKYEKLNWQNIIPVRCHSAPQRVYIRITWEQKNAKIIHTWKLQINSGTKCEGQCKKRHSVMTEAKDWLTASDTEMTRQTYDTTGLAVTLQQITCVPTSWCCDWGSLRPEAPGGNCQQALQSNNKPRCSAQQTLFTRCCHSPVLYQYSQLPASRQKQAALLSHRGRVMLPVCLVQYLKHGILLLVTAASDLPLCTIKFWRYVCSF